MLGSTALGLDPGKSPTRGVTFGLGPSQGLGQNMGCTAKAAPLNTRAAGATLGKGDTSVAVSTAPKPDLSRTVLEALAQTLQQLG